MPIFQDSTVIQDLKDFITITIRGELASQLQPVKDDVSELKNDVKELRSDVNKLQQNVERLDEKIDELSSDVAEALNTSNDIQDAKFKNHEERITRLEPRGA